MKGRGRKYEKLKPSNDMQRVYDFICDNPGTNAVEIAKSLGMKNYRRVYQLITSFENYPNMVVSEDNGKYWKFDKSELDNRFWV